MRSFAVVVLLLALVSGFVFARQQEPPGGEKAVREIIARMELAWNQRDGATYGGSFTENGDLILPNGMRINGRMAIVNGQSLALKTLYSESRISAKVETIRMLRPDVAIAHVTWILKYKLSGPERSMPTNSTIVFAKGADGKWMVEAFQGTPIL